jgi:hypothetical protein
MVAHYLRSYGAAGACIGAQARPAQRAMIAAWRKE